MKKLAILFMVGLGFFLSSCGSSDALTLMVGGSNNEIEALGVRGYREAIPAIRPLIESDNMKLVESAGIALRQLGDDRTADEAIARFAVGLQSRSPRERQVALKAIGKIGGAAARGHLEQGLRDRSPKVRQEARKRLDRLER